MKYAILLSKTLFCSLLLITNAHATQNGELGTTSKAEVTISITILPRFNPQPCIDNCSKTIQDQAGKQYNAVYFPQQDGTQLILISVE